MAQTDDLKRSLDASHHALLNLRDGDPKAVGRLVDTVRPFLKHQVAKMIGVSRGAREDATDVVQVALLQAIERIDTFQGDTLAQWRSWLITIARNQG